MLRDGALPPTGIAERPTERYVVGSVLTYSYTEFGDGSRCFGGLVDVCFFSPEACGHCEARGITSKTGPSRTVS